MNEISIYRWRRIRIQQFSHLVVSLKTRTRVGNSNRAFNRNPSCSGVQDSSSWLRLGFHSSSARCARPSPILGHLIDRALSSFQQQFGGVVVNCHSDAQEEEEVVALLFYFSTNNADSWFAPRSLLQPWTQLRSCNSKYASNKPISSAIFILISYLVLFLVLTNPQLLHCIS